MNSFTKKIIAILVSLVSLALIYYGVYLPLRKSRLYIKAILKMRTDGGLHTLEEFNRLFDPVLKFYSPVGQDEISSNYLMLIGDIMKQQSDKKIIEILVSQAEEVAEPILKKGAGFLFSQNVYRMAFIYKTASMKLNDEIYYQKAVALFEKGMEYSPNRPIFLTGLFEIYLWKGEKNKAKEIGEIILRYWPGENEVKEILEKL